MADRDELVSSAVEFLRNPQIFNAPMEKKLEFLKSKGLNDEEINRAIGSLGDPGVQSIKNGKDNTVSGYQTQQDRFSGEFPLSAPPPLPERDWKDYFIMATTTASVGYGLYYLFKKVVVPSVLPQSYNQLEKDKEAINAEFTRVQTLLDKLEQNNEKLVSRDAENAEKLELLVTKVNSLILNSENVLDKSNDDLKLIKLEIENLKSNHTRLNTAIEDLVNAKLTTINDEIDSLKKLLNTRLANDAGNDNPSVSSTVAVNGASSASHAGRPKGRVPLVSSIPSAADILKNVPKKPVTALADPESSVSPPSLSAVPSSNDVTARSSKEVDRSEIPAWQLAAGS